MNSWERFNETSLPPKKDFFSNLNLENISDEDYVHAQKVWDVFKIKNLGEYHDLYVKIDTLLIADIFESFTYMCLKFCLVFCICTWISMASLFKEEKSRIRITNRL